VPGAARGVRPAFILLLNTALLAGCRGASAAPTAVATGLPATPCSRTAAPGTFHLSLQIGGVPRTVIVHIPAGYTDRQHVPLVLNLHGSGSTAAQEEGFSGMDRAADTDGFIVAYPQGAIPSGSGFDWNVPGQPLFGGAIPPATAANDVTFIGDLIERLETGLCIDTTRVYATGFSGGARMTSQLGCDLSGVIAAIAPVSGLRLPAPCDSSRAVPVVSFHGTKDPVDPYGGNGQAYWTYSVQDAARRWAAHDGCAPSPESSRTSGGAEVTLYAGCASGSTVELYTIPGEGHEWPGGPPLPAVDTGVLGPQSDAVNADAVMWQFFSAHPLP